MGRAGAGCTQTPAPPPPAAYAPLDLQQAATAEELSLLVELRGASMAAKSGKAAAAPGGRAGQRDASVQVRQRQQLGVVGCAARRNVALAWVGNACHARSC